MGGGEGMSVGRGKGLSEWEREGGRGISRGRGEHVHVCVEEGMCSYGFLLRTH